MITIPIWVFVISVTLSAILTLIVGFYIVSYIKYMQYQDEKIRQKLGENYGTKDKKR